MVACIQHFRIESTLFSLQQTLHIASPPKIVDPLYVEVDVERTKCQFRVHWGNKIDSKSKPTKIFHQNFIVCCLNIWKFLWHYVSLYSSTFPLPILFSCFLRLFLCYVFSTTRLIRMCSSLPLLETEREAKRSQQIWWNVYGFLNVCELSLYTLSLEYYCDTYYLLHEWQYNSIQLDSPTSKLQIRNPYYDVVTRIKCFFVVLLKSYIFLALRLSPFSKWQFLIRQILC